MKDYVKILQWIKNSDLPSEQQDLMQEHFEVVKKEDELKSFQIKRLKENIKINTRFLNKAVRDLEKNVNLLKDSNRQLSNFTKIASHDLKSPLRSINSFTSLLKRNLEGKLTEKELQYFGFIESNSKSMVELIDDLLLFTKINSEDFNFNDEELTNMLQEVLTGLDYDLKANNVKVEHNFKPAVINCDSIKFKQVLQNLISNSIKFSTFSGNQPSISLGFSEGVDEWVFSVEDNGIGIAEEYKADIFQEFKKLNGNSFDGTGMGLSIAKKIVNKHKGKIWVEPKEESGTTIMFSIAKCISSADRELNI